MTGTWIAAAAGALLLGALAAGALVLLARRRARPSGRRRAVVVSLEDSTIEDRDSGAVRSVQKADVLIDQDALAEIWTPEHLERLARTYWHYLTRVTLGLIRVHYTETLRAVVLVSEPFRLLTFQAPEYELDPLRGLVRWRIERGLLVSRLGRNGRGYLQIAVQRDRPEQRAAEQARASTQRAAEQVHGDEPAARAAEQQGRVHIRVEVAVANFYPAIATGISRRFYNATQSRLHVLITYGFLRSLTRLDLAQSRVGKLRAQ